ncbi:Methylated-DNA--protein-cysteine methyltransferase [Galdieria sulphuraria]|uniref:Methylated-DNA--protein-cysteine methyltransferase n=1 Tax=Galdieria sulphuraria TaxID=130081 RepID=M2XCA0_GALSU|nr:methylated-DNA-[protein]-cysteine S-methyltransferase [Galdieria sulphuraria]EME27547.1 methylated-DNA-[protein]-cysteine S-methyltransferase [Galdieria sulphuraria]GJD09746.1 Methylated-DNA--protein-cysteine methyltransferase [Galdieria sulphuraria]|eukprot:XP_005704067.1 methylated-DNA-[protein]-cysteine S-methyltransferase [Galdieria sulphuraria]
MTLEGTKCKILPQIHTTCCICESNLSEFQQRVYHTIAKIEKGQVTTYGELAKALDSAPRAVGQALKRNPFNSDEYIPRVPCHRVISKNCTLGGFSGKTDVNSAEIKKKLELLESEGLKFQNFKLKESMHDRILNWQQLSNIKKY